MGSFSFHQASWLTWQQLAFKRHVVHISGKTLPLFCHFPQTFEDNSTSISPCLLHSNSLFFFSHSTIQHYSLKCSHYKKKS